MQPLWSPEVSWVVGELQQPLGLEQVDAIGSTINVAIFEIIGINVWPLTNTSCFEYTGDRELSPYHPDHRPFTVLPTSPKAASTASTPTSIETIPQRLPFQIFQNEEKTDHNDDDRHNYQPGIAYAEDIYQSLVAKFSDMQHISLKLRIDGCIERRSYHDTDNAANEGIEGTVTDGTD